MNLLHIRRELQKRPRPIRWLMSRVLLRSGLCKMLRIRAHETSFRFNPSELSADLWYNPNCRSSDVQFLKAYVKPGDNIVDVGANIGIWTLVAGSKVQSNGSVIAFEPHPRIFKFLESNAALNGLRNVTLHNCALGEQRGSASLSDVKADDMNRLDPSASGGLTVPIVTLDETLKELGPIALLKIDAEGYEPYILRGAERIIGQVQCLFIEISTEALHAYNCRREDVADWLTDHGFRLYFATGNKLRSLSDGWDASVENVIAVRSEEDFCRRTGWAIQKQEAFA